MELTQILILVTVIWALVSLLRQWRAGYFSPQYQSSEGDMAKDAVVYVHTDGINC